MTGSDVHQTMRYEYNGTGRFVHTETYGPGAIDVEWTMNTAAGAYGHWDRFGRTLKQRWFRSTTTHDQFDYTYDYAGNRLTRDIPSSLYATNDLDQGYAYDGLQRLKNGQQGTLASGSITSRNFEQGWTLDQLGNWPTFKERDTDTGGTWDLDQSRSHNLVNELTEFTTTSWIDPAYDAAGNMTTMPQPLDPANDYTATYDAWNRLAEVADGMTTVATYEYDGNHHRIVRDVTRLWCISKKMRNDQRILEKRMPSAHVSVNSSGELATFLNPFDGTAWTDPLDNGLICLASHGTGIDRRLR